VAAAAMAATRLAQITAIQQVLHRGLGFWRRQHPEQRRPLLAAHHPKPAQNGRKYLVVPATSPPGHSVDPQGRTYNTQCEQRLCKAPRYISSANSTDRILRCGGMSI